MAQGDEAQWRAVLARDPDDVVALGTLGNLLRMGGRAGEAVALLERAARLAPGMAEVAFVLGLALVECGEAGRAEAEQRRALALRPGWHEPYLALAGALMAQERLAEAGAAAEAALGRAPGDAMAWMVRGEVRAARDDRAGAIGDWQQALVLNPDCLPALRLLGQAWLAEGSRLRDRSLVAAAVGPLRRARDLAPGVLSVWLDLGQALSLAVDPGEAAAVLRVALERWPGEAGLHATLGAVWAEAQLPEAAEAAFAAACDCDAGLVAGHVGLGFARLAQGDEAGGAAALARVGSLDAVRPLERWNAALATLMLGDLARGWDLYEARWGLPGKRLPAGAWWDGSADPAGQVVRLVGEQGFGDVIQFARYAPLLAACGAEVEMQVAAPLARLLGGLAGVARVVAEDAPVPETGLVCAVGSLPRAFGTRMGTIPGAPYLTAEAARPDREALRVGVAWSGGAGWGLQRGRSVPLAEFRALFAVPGCRFHVMQAEVRAEDASCFAALGEAVAPGLVVGDFADTAVALAAMDVVVTVDTAVAHLAGALGCEVWVLLMAVPDWRWMIGRADSPWYPTARLFRQRRQGEWGPVLAEVGAALRARVGA